MKLLQKFSSQLKIANDLFSFLWQRKFWWLIPFVIILLILGGLFILAQSSAIAPFIYSLF